MTTAWCYLVVSSSQQADTIEHQRAWALETARTKGWGLERFFEGVATGKHGPRSILKDLLTELRSAEFRPDWVLMIRLDRVGRGSIAESQFLLHEIHTLGVRIWTRDGGEEKNDTATDEFIRAAKLFTARHENDVRREKSANAHARKRREGKHAGHPPYGVVLIEGRPVPYEPEAQFIRDIFSRRLTGWGTHRLARYAAGHAPPKRTADGESRVMKWGASTIARMLACKTYRVLVVDEDTFDAVQGIQFPGIDRSTKYRWPLRGALRCTCGHAVSTVFSGPTGHRIRYYTCRNVAVHGKYPYHRADIVEENFVELMRAISVDPSLFYDESKTDENQLRENVKSLDQEIRSLEERRLKVWEIAETGGIPADEVGRRVNELNDKIRDLERSRSEIKRTLAVSGSSRYNAADVIRQMVEDWPCADVDSQREVAKAVSELVGGLYLDPSRKNEVIRH